MGMPIDLRAAVEAIVKLHGGVRPAARAIGVNYAYLSRLRTGDKTNPTAAVLRKLGLRKVVTYETIRPVRTVVEIDGGRLEMRPVRG